MTVPFMRTLAGTLCLLSLCVLLIACSKTGNDDALQGIAIVPVDPIPVSREAQLRFCDLYEQQILSDPQPVTRPTTPESCAAQTLGLSSPAEKVDSKVVLRDVATCEAGNVTGRDDCYDMIARKYRLPEYCLQITRQGCTAQGCSSGRAECLNYLITSLMNPEVCKRANSSWCYVQIASLAQNRSICDSIPEAPIRDVCIVQSGPVAASVCDALSGDPATFCWRRVATEAGDIGLCPKENTHEQQACIQAIAQKTGRPEYCTLVNATDMRWVGREQCRELASLR